MKKTICILASLLITAGTVFLITAAEHYIRADATGDNSGSDWVNAFTDLPDTLVRGDIYYLADGEYCPNGYQFDDDADGKTIAIKKATESEHGTETGWNSAYGDGQAIFTSMLSFKTSNWIFDGMVGSGPDSTSYGFKIEQNDELGVDHYLIKAPHSGDIDSIQISHCSMTMKGKEYEDGLYGQICLYVGGDDPTDHYIISHNYMAFAHTCLVLYNSSNTIVENNYFSTNWSSPEAHGQLVAPGWDSDDVIFRNNVFLYPGVFVFGGHVAGSERWKVYNNIVIGDGSKVNAGFANATSADTNIILKSEFHHNTFYNLDFGRGAIFIGYLSGDVAEDRSTAYNNIFYKVKDVHSGMNYTPGSLIYENNAYYDCWGIFNPGSTSIVADSIDPFVNSSQFNFRLKEPIVTDKVLPPPYDVDFYSNIRGEDGNWDVGAIEFDETDAIHNFSKIKHITRTNIRINGSSLIIRSPLFVKNMIFNCRIVTVNGKEVFSSMINVYSNQIKIPIVNFSAGVYLVKISNESTDIVRRFVKN